MKHDRTNKDAERETRTVTTFVFDHIYITEDAGLLDKKQQSAGKRVAGNSQQEFSVTEPQEPRLDIEFSAQVQQQDGQ